MDSLIEKLEDTVLVELPISTYLKFFGKERLDKVEFLPLIDRGDIGFNKYEIDWNKYDGDTRYDLLFKFFSKNMGEKVEVGVIWGAMNCILSKSTFIVGGRLESDWIKPKEILENGYCHSHFDFRNIYYAKRIEQEVEI